MCLKLIFKQVEDPKKGFLKDFISPVFDTMDLTATITESFSY